MKQLMPWLAMTGLLTAAWGYIVLPDSPDADWHLDLGVEQNRY